MTNTKSKGMKLTNSKRYYFIQEGENTRFFSLDKQPIPLAKGKCLECGDVMESKRCGHFVECSCGKSYVDTDRWFPERHRYGGCSTQIE